MIIIWVAHIYVTHIALQTVMNIVFAATGLLMGVVGAGVALVWHGADVSEDRDAKVGGAGVQENAAVVSPPIMLNKYQVYMFLSEFLRMSHMTKPCADDLEDQLSHFEFYRIIYKLVKPMATKMQAAQPVAPVRGQLPPTRYMRTDSQAAWMG